MHEGVSEAFFFFKNECVIPWMYLDLFFILSGPTVSSIRKHILRYSHLDSGIGGTNGDTCIFYVLKMLHAVKRNQRKQIITNLACTH